MRKALIGILMAATAATPLAAQDGGWRGRGHDNGEQRSQRAEQRAEARQQRQEAQPQRFQQQPQQQQNVQPQRFERQQAQQTQRYEGRGNWGGQRNFQQQQQQQQAQVQVQAQQQEQVRAERRQGWNGERQRQGDRNGFAAQREGVVAQDQRVAEQYRRDGNRSNWQGDRNDRRSDGNRSNWQNDRNDRRWDGNRSNWQNGRNDRRWEGNRDRVRWDRSWRNNGRYDWQRYRYSNRRIFHLGPYYAPYRSWAYRPLEIGFVLESLFYDRNYWIDPGYYDLPPAPPGAEWVRYYNDVLLVDIDSGEVIDVIHDFFW